MIRCRLAPRNHVVPQARIDRRHDLSQGVPLSTSLLRPRSQATTPPVGTATGIMVAGAGILEVSENRPNAERFLRFMLSTVAQQYFAGATFEYPLVEGVNTHRLLPPISELNGPDIDAAKLTDIAGTQALLRDLGIIP